MRYRVEFRYREDTGEIELLQVDAIETGQRAADHDAQHDRVAAEVASVIEQFAVIDEIADPASAAGHRIPASSEEASRSAQQLSELSDG